MVTHARAVAVCMFVAGCGLERDWAAWQMASQGAIETSSSTAQTGTTSDTSSDDTGGPGSTQTTGDVPPASDTSGPADSTDGSSSSSFSSTGETSYCGDGIVDALAEECDDGNSVENDRCTSDCLKIRLAFITSITTQGDLNSEANADAQCKSLASKAMQADPFSPITDASNFKVLLPFTHQSVFDRHYHGAGPYQLVNGLRVSDSFDALFSEPHQNPINVDEQSMTRHAGVWTGMGADGEAYPGVDLCEGWTSLGGTATFGYSDYVDSWWLYTDVVGNPTIDCGLELALYCLEQE